MSGEHTDTSLAIERCYTRTVGMIGERETKWIITPADERLFVMVDRGGSQAYLLYSEVHDTWVRCHHTRVPSFESKLGPLSNVLCISCEAIDEIIAGRKPFLEVAALYRLGIKQPPQE